MKFLIALLVIFSTVTALAVPHPHPEESKVDTPTKFATVNVSPENDDPNDSLNEQPWHIKRYDNGDDRKDDDHPMVRDDYIDSIINHYGKDSLGKRGENLVYYEYDDTGDFLERREHIYADEIGEDDNSEVITNEHHWHLNPSSVVNKRDEEDTLTGEGYYNQEDLPKKREVNYIPPRAYDPGNLPVERDGYLSKETDINNSPREKNALEEDKITLLNECLWKFKKDENCVDEQKLQRREPEADDENYWRPKGDEKYDQKLEADFEYISKRDGYDEEEDEYLRRIYEGIHYDGGEKNHPKRDSCCLGDVEAKQADCDCSDQVGDDYHWVMEEGEDGCSGDPEVVDYPAGDYDDDGNFAGIMEYEANKVKGEYYPSIGIVGKSPASHRHMGEYTDDLPTNNRYLCETTKDSPTVADVVEIVNIFRNQKGGERCMAKNALGSRCTKLCELGSAQISICTVHTGWFVYCDDVGKYALELTRRCKGEIDGVWRVGGTIFHESGKGSLIVY